MAGPDGPDPVQPDPWPKGPCSAAAPSPAAAAPLAVCRCCGSGCRCRCCCCCCCSCHESCRRGQDGCGCGCSPRCGPGRRGCPSVSSHHGSGGSDSDSRPPPAAIGRCGAREHSVGRFSPSAPGCRHRGFCGGCRHGCHAPSGGDSEQRQRSELENARRVSDQRSAGPSAVDEDPWRAADAGDGPAPPAAAAADGNTSEFQGAQVHPAPEDALGAVGAPPEAGQKSCGLAVPEASVLAFSVFCVIAGCAARERLVASSCKLHEAAESVLSGNSSDSGRTFVCQEAGLLANLLSHLYFPGCTHAFCTSTVIDFAWVGSLVSG